MPFAHLKHPKPGGIHGPLEMVCRLLENHRKNSFRNFRKFRRHKAAKNSPGISLFPVFESESNWSQILRRISSQRVLDLEIRWILMSFKAFPSYHLDRIDGLA